MKTCAVLLFALFCATGCDKSDKPNNSKIQTPNDQPIGMPKPLGGDDKPVRLDNPADPKGKNNKPLPPIEIKQDRGRTSPDGATSRVR